MSDEEIGELAAELVEEIVERGPFLSLAEFVNRRVDRGELGLKGALQAAIDRAGLNAAARQDRIATNKYEANSRNNISPADTGVGIPGYLTQADVLKPLAPIITVRSDTFTIRTYGEARNGAGEVIARAWAEAVVQRVPDFVDDRQAPHTAVEDLNEVNARFGRKFRIISFRYLTGAEVAS